MSDNGTWHRIETPIGSACPDCDASLHIEINHRAGQFRYYINHTPTCPLLASLDPAVKTSERAK